jgi:hypothetical protein
MLRPIFANTPPTALEGPSQRITIPITKAISRAVAIRGKAARRPVRNRRTSLDEPGDMVKTSFKNV